MTADRRPESQEQILEAAVDSLTEADIPPAEQDGWLDPDTDPPAELAVLADAELAELLAAAPPRPAPPTWPLSYQHPDGPGGTRWPTGPGPRDADSGTGFTGGGARSGPRDGDGVAGSGSGAESGPRNAGSGAESGPRNAGSGAESGPRNAGSGAESGPRNAGSGAESGPRNAGDGAESGPQNAGDGAESGPQNAGDGAECASGSWAGFASSGPGFASGPGAGFAEGGPLDVMAAGMALAGFADDAHSRLAVLTDNELIGVLRAWRRQASWAQARELSAVAELARRRPADGTPPAVAPGEFPARLSEFIAAEVAAALTLTGCAAGAELDLALDLAVRPATSAALEAGQIDLARTKIITAVLGPLAAAHADAVEAQVLPRAGEMTTGQLRAALQRAVLAVDPDAARRRREEAEGEARVEHWADPEGTAGLAGRYLPPAAALAASSRLTQVAAAWKKRGAQGGMDLLRAHVYLALLNGQSVDAPPPSLLPVAAAPGGSGADGSGAGTPVNGEPAPGLDDGPATGGQQIPAGLRGPVTRGQQIPVELRGPCASELPPTAGLVNLTVPLTTLLGLADAPGESAGYGPLDASTTRQLARALAGHPATRWQITVTGPGGHALAHGSAHGPVTPARDGPGTGWTVAVTAEPIAAGTCDHRNADPGYRPGAALQRLIRARTVTCAGPGCRRPAARCDLDHTTPHDQGGITCECNLAPLCRFCHRLKQAEGWTLKQGNPGAMTWITPAGRRYTILPSKHPT